MQSIPFAIASDNESEFYDNVLRTFRDMFDSVGGAAVGDVFYCDGDTFTLGLNTENTGLFKNSDDELDFLLDASAIHNTPSGNISSTNVHAALNELDGAKIGNDGSTDCYLGSLQILQIPITTRGADSFTIIAPRKEQGQAFFWSEDPDVLWVELAISGTPKGWTK